MHRLRCGCTAHDASGSYKPLESQMDFVGDRTIEMLGEHHIVDVRAEVDRKILHDANSSLKPPEAERVKVVADVTGGVDDEDSPSHSGETTLDDVKVEPDSHEEGEAVRGLIH